MLLVYLMYLKLLKKYCQTVTRWYCYAILPFIRLYSSHC